MRIEFNNATAIECSSHYFWVENLGLCFKMGCMGFKWELGNVITVALESWNYVPGS